MKFRQEESFYSNIWKKKNKIVKVKIKVFHILKGTYASMSFLALKQPKDIS